MKSRKSFHTFQEYLTHKGKVQNKPKVEEVPDYDGPKPKAPAPAATKGDGWAVPKTGKKGTPAAYKNGSDKAPKKGEKGFGDMGDKALVYDPADDYGTSKGSNGVAGGKETKTWPKGGTTTESLLRKTKDMSVSEFAKHVKKGLNEHCGCEDKKAPHVVAYSVGAFHPDPIQAIRYVSYLANENVNLRHALVREAARAGCAATLLQDMLMLPESFKALAKIIDGENGETFSRRLEKAIRENREEHLKRAKINEEVDEPAHDDDLDVDDADESELEDPDKKPDEDSDDEPDMGDDDEDGGDEDAPDMGGDEDGPPPDPDMGGDDASGPDLGGDDAGGPDLGGDDGDTPPDPDMGGDDAGGPDLGGDDAPDMGGDEEGDGPPPVPGDDGGDDDNISFGDDSDGDDEHGDDDDLDLDDDSDDDDEHGDDDDLDLDDDSDDDGDGDDKPKKKMPWEDD